jgi:hypothetical protein
MKTPDSQDLAALAPVGGSAPSFWNKGPALGGGGTQGECTERWPSGLWGDGDTLLIAVEVTNRNSTEDTRWEYAAVRIACDEHYFELWDMSTGDIYDAWMPESWSWWAQIPSLPNVVMSHGASEPKQP